MSTSNGKGKNSNANLTRRLEDVEGMARALLDMLEEARGKSLPPLLLSRLHVDSDKIAARLEKHHRDLEAVSK